MSLGVVWYLNTCVESNNDGRFTDYRNLRSCNPYLHDQLLQIRAKGRSLEHVEAAEVLRAGTRFYRESVPFTANPCFSPAARDKECARRKAWHEEALRKLAEVELVFLDPDNGLAGTRVKPYSQRSVKYAFREELGDWLDGGKSVVLYQHQQRKPLEEQVRCQLKELGRSGWALTFHRLATRIYYVLPAILPHKTILMERTKAFLDTEWGTKEHFRLRTVYD